MVGSHLLRASHRDRPSHTASRRSHDVARSPSRVVGPVKRMRLPSRLSVGRAEGRRDGWCDDGVGLRAAV